jgi:hypothetical protein
MKEVNFMLQEYLTILTTHKLEELRKDPAKHEEFLKMTIASTNLVTELLKDSAEFRKAFAAAHTELFKHPECQETIRAIKKAAHGDNN